MGTKMGNLALSLLICIVILVSAVCAKVHNNQLSQLFVESSGPGSCVMKKCSSETVTCTSDPKCFEATQCNAACVNAPDVDSCNLLCELNYGYNNTAYTELLDCMVENSCLPESPYDGKEIILLQV